MNNIFLSGDTKIATLNGALLVLLYSIDSSQILTSVIVAATGALVSFLVTVFLKFLWEQINNDIEHIDY